MVAVKFDRRQISQDRNVENVHKGAMFAFDKSRESLDTNIVIHTITKPSITERLTFSSKYGHAKARNYLELEDYTDRMDVKNRQKCEVSQYSEHFNESDIIEMSRYIFRSHSEGRLQQSKDKLNNYEVEERKLDYMLDPPLLKNYYSIVKHISNKSDRIINSNISNEDLMYTEYPANNHRRNCISTKEPHLFIHDSLDLRGSRVAKVIKSDVSDFTVKPKDPTDRSTSNLYLTRKLRNNYQFGREKQNLNKLKYINIDHSDIDNKISKMRQSEEEEAFSFEKDLLAEDKSKFLIISIY